MAFNDPRDLGADAADRKRMSASDDEYVERKMLTFAQAEGFEALPAQMKREEISGSFRAKIWDLVLRHIRRAGGYEDRFVRPWDSILRSMWVDFSHYMIDEYPNHTRIVIVSYLKPIFEASNYVRIYGALQFIVRSPDCPSLFRDQLTTLLKNEQAAFRLVNGDTFLPVGTDQEVQAIEGALAAATQARQAGARAHLIEASRKVSSGAFADSVKESIHAVESVARNLAPSGKLSDALAILEGKSVIHKAMKRGFEALYGYASDEEGIRHPLLESGASQVNEADALFMLGACASFVSYMISRAREAGLISDGS